MKLYKVSKLEDYLEMIDEIVELDQPVFLYKNTSDEDLILVSEDEVDDVDNSIEDMKKSKEKEKKEIDEDEPIWDDDLNDMPDWFLYF